MEGRKADRPVSDGDIEMVASHASYRMMPNLNPNPSHKPIPYDGIYKGT